MLVSVPGNVEGALDSRISHHHRTSAALADLDDVELTELIRARQDGVLGIGGARTRIQVDRHAVFVKCLPLTDLEREPGAVGSTANLFGLPAHCHYGVGSPGFSAWRELAATQLTSSWVLARRSESFPLLHHWRVLPGAAPLSDELHDIEASVAYWGGHPAMRHRLQALTEASASVVLFLEHIPTNLSDWLTDQAASGEEASQRAATILEAQLLAGTAFMAANGMVHFDTHFGNVLTDGHRLYFADLGLAAITDFALSADETALVERSRTHDVSYVIARLVNWLVETFGPSSCASPQQPRPRLRPRRPNRRAPGASSNHRRALRAGCDDCQLVLRRAVHRPPRRALSVRPDQHRAPPTRYRRPTIPSRSEQPLPLMGIPRLARSAVVTTLPRHVVRAPAPWFPRPRVDCE